MNDIKVSASGTIAFWSCSGDTDFNSLLAKLQAAGLGPMAPKRRSQFSALSAAAHDYADWLEATGRSVSDTEIKIVNLKQPHKNGLELRRVEKGNTKNEYEHVCSLNVVGGVVAVTEGTAYLNEVQMMFDKRNNSVTSEAVGASLRAIVSHLNGISLRDTGGVYWIPEDAMATWESVCGIYEEYGHRIYGVGTLMDDGTMRVVRDFIVKEITTAASQLITEANSGELREEALENRKREAMAMRDKVLRYEGYLGEALDGLKAVTQTAETAVVTAAMMQMPG